MPADVLFFRPKRVDMRLLLRQHCHACDHRWVAPACGRCPACHAHETRVEDVDYCNVVRAN